MGRGQHSVSTTKAAQHGLLFGPRQGRGPTGIVTTLQAQELAVGDRIPLHWGLFEIERHYPEDNRHLCVIGTAVESHNTDVAFPGSSLSISFLADETVTIEPRPRSLHDAAFQKTPRKY